MSYQPGIPTGTVNLDVDYQNLQNNFQQLDTQFGIDHIPFSNTSGVPPGGVNGYHQNIHFNPFSTTVTNAPNNWVPATSNPQGVPAATPGFGQLFSSQVNDGINTDEMLFWLSGGNRSIPLTRNLTPVYNTNGYTCLPGGFVMLWARVALSNFQGQRFTVTFSTTAGIAFPANCFTLQVSLICKSGGTNSSDNTLCVVDGTITRTSFQIQYNGIGGGSYVGFFYWAIGN